MRIRVFHNTCPMAMAAGYQPGDPVVEVWAYDTVTTDPYTAAEQAFALFDNGDDSPCSPSDPRAAAYRRRRNRPLRMGDVVACDQGFYACELGGFTKIQPPTHAWGAQPGTTPITTDSPHTPPDRRDGPRRIEARWSLGEPTGDGWQRQAALAVTYAKGYGYQAVLSTVEEQTASGCRTERFSYDDPDTVVHTESASRLHRATFGRAYQTAVSVVRRRFDDGDPDVVRFFLPAA